MTAEREALPRAELHRRFAEALAAAAPGSVFAFEIDAKAVAGPDGCNWYPLASLSGWRGDVTANLDAFRAVRAALSARYNLAEEEAGAG